MVRVRVRFRFKVIVRVKVFKGRNNDISNQKQHIRIILRARDHCS